MNSSIIILLVVIALLAARRRRETPIPISGRRLAIVFAAIVMLHVAVIGCLVLVNRFMHS